MDNKTKKNTNDKIDKNELSNALNNVLSKPTSLKEKINLSDLLELKRALNPRRIFVANAIGQLV